MSALKSQYGSPMVSLTTTQRDLLHLLLTTELPIGVPAIGQQLRVTPRQVHYSLREIKTWLARHHTTLQHTPGVGDPGDLLRGSEITAAGRARLSGKISAYSNSW